MFVIVTEIRALAAATLVPTWRLLQQTVHFALLAFCHIAIGLNRTCALIISAVGCKLL